MELKAEKDGLALGAFRLAMYHYRGLNSSLNGSSHVKSAFLIVADECDSGTSSLEDLVRRVSAAEVESVVNGSSWSVNATYAGVSLSVARDVSEPHCQRWGCVTDRRVNGAVVVPVPLTMNGEALVPLPNGTRTIY